MWGELLQLAILPNPNWVEQAISEGADIDVCDASGYTPLYLACSENHLTSACLLVRAGADPYAATEAGDCAFAYASRQGQEAVVRALIAAGHDLDAPINELRYTPLHLACKYGYTAIAALLLEGGADVDAQTRNGETPQDLARDSGIAGAQRADIVELLSRWRQRQAAQPALAAPNKTPGPVL